MLPNGEYRITSKLHSENALEAIGNTVYAVQGSLNTWDVKLNPNTGDYTIVQHGNQLNGFLDYVLNTTKVMIHKPHVPTAGPNQRWKITSAGAHGYSIQNVANPAAELTTALPTAFVINVNAVRDESLPQNRWEFALREKK